MLFRSTRLRSLVETIRLLHADGYPLPLYGPVLPIEGAVLVIQQACVGLWRDVVTHELLDALLECNRMQVGRGETIDDEPWAEFLVRTLIEGADGWCLHEPLRTHSRETSRLLDQIERIGRDLNQSSLPDADLVHIDFHHRNVRMNPFPSWRSSAY